MRFVKKICCRNGEFSFFVVFQHMEFIYSRKRPPVTVTVTVTDERLQCPLYDFMISRTVTVTEDGTVTVTEDRTVTVTDI